MICSTTLTGICINIMYPGTQSLALHQLHFFFVHTHLSLSQHFDNRRTLSEGYSFRAESLKLKSSCKLDAGYRDVRFHKVTFQNIRDAGATLKKKKKNDFPHYPSQELT